MTARFHFLVQGEGFWSRSTVRRPALPDGFLSSDLHIRRQYHRVSGQSLMIAPTHGVLTAFYTAELLYLIDECASVYWQTSELVSAHVFYEWYSKFIAWDESLPTQLKKPESEDKWLPHLISLRYVIGGHTL